MTRFHRWISAILLPLTLAACATAAAPRDSLDAIARDYVRLQLAIGEKEEGYIDAYYGPDELKSEGKALGAASSLPQLASKVDALQARLAAAAAAEPRRTAFLQAQLTAARTRLRMLGGEKLSFEEEAVGLFAVRPELKPLTAYDPVLARIDNLVPGQGPLWQRVDAFQDRFTIPKERLKPAFDAAIAECRTRTMRHMTLPPTETFAMAFVTGKSWSGYNYYQGDFASKIEINTDLPIRISRAVDLGCHEGYPGHHVLNVLLEQRLVRGRGWIEHSVQPLFSPQSIISEGSANYGIDLAFPGPEKLAYEVRALYPLAGLPVADAARYDALLTALRDLGGARFTIAREFLEGRVPEAEAVALTQKYQLVSEARARQSIAFTKQYRTYVINYGLGRDMVQADVDSHGPDQAAKWRRMEQILSEPTLPSDLRAR
ncbi:hypothetical protein ACFQPG_01885 [Sphingomonas sp. GCM10030256]|uniref:hypothetical protein n=1 Tax=Sphingomonas sp. GCM10030256 TaxID=3273427 RepID=UPI003610F41E